MRQLAVGEARAIDMPAEADVVGGFRTRELPRIAEGQPVFRIFLLPAVLDGLAEEAVIVTNAVADRVDLQGRHAVHEAGGEASKPAVAERGVGFEFAQLIEVDAKIGERRPHFFGEAEIGQSVHEQTPDQKLEREIIDAPVVFAIAALDRGEPGRRNAVSRCERRGDEPIPRTRGGLVLADGRGELTKHLVAKGAGFGVEFDGGGS